jgi:hypothetical protein
MIIGCDPRPFVKAALRQGPVPDFLTPDLGHSTLDPMSASRETVSLDYGGNCVPGLKPGPNCAATLNVGLLINR